MKLVINRNFTHIPHNLMVIVVIFVVDDVIHKRPLLSSDGKLMEANKALRLLMVLWEQFTHKLLSFSLRKRLKL